MGIFVLTTTYELRVSRRSHLRDHPTRHWASRVLASQDKKGCANLGLFAVHKIVSKYAGRIFAYIEKMLRDTKLRNEDISTCYREKKNKRRGKEAGCNIAKRGGGGACSQNWMTIFVQEWPLCCLESWQWDINTSVVLKSTFTVCLTNLYCRIDIS